MVYAKFFRCGVEYASLLGAKAWCLVLGLGCASAQWRRWLSFVAAYIGKLAGRVARVSLWFCVCVSRGFNFFCRLWQSKQCLRRYSPLARPPHHLHRCSSFHLANGFGVFGAASADVSSLHRRGVFLKRKKTELGSLVSGQGVGRDFRGVIWVLDRRGTEDWCLDSSSSHPALSGGYVAPALFPVHGDLVPPQSAVK
ncbi:hypothetical protein YC2023_028849 [Brassica napus]